eukprot:1775275-Pyramimonas_sp.AAC.1
MSPRPAGDRRHAGRCGGHLPAPDWLLRRAMPVRDGQRRGPAGGRLPPAGTAGSMGLQPAVTANDRRARRPRRPRRPERRR